MMRPPEWPILALLMLSARVFGNVDALPQGAGRQIENHHAVIALAFSPDGKTLAACCDDDNIRCWDVGTGKPGRCLELTSERSHERRIRSNLASPQLAFSADGKTLSASFPVVVVERGEPSSFDVIKQWDFSTGKELREIRGEKDESLTVVRDIGGALMGIGIRKDQLRCWDLTTGKQRFAWGTRQHAREFKAGWQFRAFSANGQIIVTSPYLVSKLLTCQETGHGQILRDILDRESGIAPPLALSPNGRIVAVAVGIRDVSKIRMWETKIEPKTYPPRTRRNVPTPPPAVPAFNEEVTSLNFSPDAKMLAIAGQEGTICLWETVIAKERRRFTGQQGPIQALAFSPDGRFLASGGRDGVVLLWDVKPPESAGRPPDTKLSSEQLQTLWDRMADKDAVRAYRAIHRMRAAPQQAIRFLKQRLPLLLEADHQRIQRLLVDLDSDQFAVRARADEELRKWGASALPVLSRALTKKPSLEVRRRVESIIEDIRAKTLTTERLRYVRAVEVLEHSGTAEGQEFLRLLSERASDPYLQQEAQEATRRLAGSAAKAR